MPCPDYKGKEYLFLSREMNRYDRIRYLRHLKGCHHCKEALEQARVIWNQMENLTQHSPNPEIRKDIFNAARMRNLRVGVSKIEKTGLRQWMTNPRFSWGLATAFVVAFAMIITSYIFIRSRQPNHNELLVDENILTWQDDFLFEVEFLDTEISRVESGQLLATYFSEVEQTVEWEGQLSTMSEDFNWVRSEIDNLMENLFGI